MSVFRSQRRSRAASLNYLFGDQQKVARYCQAESISCLETLIGLPGRGLFSLAHRARGRPQGVPTMGDFVAARNPGTDSAAFNVTYAESVQRELY
jgi:hypothetical protein